MTQNPVLFYVFILSNVAIVAGYLFVAVFVAPRFRIRSLATRVGGVGFFLLCGMTHASLAYYALQSDSHAGHGMGGASDVDVAMFVIHVLQAPAVWVFVVGLYVELGRFGGLAVDCPDAVRVAAVPEQRQPPE